MSKNEFMPRLMVCECDGPYPDLKIYDAHPKDFGHGLFKAEFYSEYLSKREHDALMDGFVEKCLAYIGTQHDIRYEAYTRFSTWLNSERSKLWSPSPRFFPR